jgi:hypothetical protein
MYKFFYSVLFGLLSPLSSLFFLLLFSFRFSLLYFLSLISGSPICGGGCGLHLWVRGCSVAMGFGGRGVWVVDLWWVVLGLWWVANLGFGFGLWGWRWRCFVDELFWVYGWVCVAALWFW